MTVVSSLSSKPSAERSLRLWPGLLLSAAAAISRFALPLVAPQLTMQGLIGGAFAGLLIVVWWLFASRAPWPERLVAPALMVAAVLGAQAMLDESMATAGMGVLYYFWVVATLAVAFVAWAAITGGWSPWPRRLTLLATILLACFAWTLLRTRGITGDGDSDFTWRWSETRDSRLAAADPPLTVSGGGDIAIEAEWPGFRGPRRDGVIPGVRIDTDWETTPPVELWRRELGPGWSSFAVRGDLVYTQEQRGADEVIAAYRLADGEPAWQHRDAARFWESMGGVGPRATPTVFDGRVYALGATGLLNVLDDDDGTVVWSRDVVADGEREVPTWGFAGSPLVLGDLVIVAAAGQLLAYQRATGEPRWRGPSASGYSSPQLFRIGGATQVALLGSSGAIGVAPEDGAVLWKHEWSTEPIVQPAITDDGDLLVSSGGQGMSRITVRPGADGWTVIERWTTNRLKPYFSDFVVHRGHAYGFDGGILACIDLEDGERAWKGGRYGHGQLVLLADQDVLLVLGERGELALVSATPETFREIASAPAIAGKTWNHPVLVRDLLLVRNDREMAAFRLTLTR